LEDDRIIGTSDNCCIFKLSIFKNKIFVDTVRNIAFGAIASTKWLDYANQL